MVFAMMLFPALSGVFSDEIILKEGKAIQGTITHEDAKEYTILLGSNMVLRVAKNKVSKVVRPESAKPNRPTIRSENLGAPASTSTAVVKSTVAASPPPAATPAPVPVSDGVERDRVKKGPVLLEKNTIMKTVAAAAPEPAAIKTAWQTSWDGEPGKEEGQFKWKWAIVRATITHAVPEGKSADWDRFEDKARAYTAERSKIYWSSSEAFAEQLASLRSPDEASLRQESARLFQQMKSQVDTKRKGFDRRTKNFFDNSPK